MYTMIFITRTKKHNIYTLKALIEIDGKRERQRDSLYVILNSVTETDFLTIICNSLSPKNYRLCQKLEPFTKSASLHPKSQLFIMG